MNLNQLKSRPENYPPKPADKSIHFSPFLAESAKRESAEVLTRLKTAAEGLTDAEAARRLAEVGSNVVVSDKHRGWPWLLWTAARNPLVILLGVLASISFATGDARAGTVMAAALGFTPLPGLYWPILTFTVLGYVVLTQLVKMWLLRRGWI